MSRSGVSIHADDTPVPVLDPGRGKTKTGRLWVAVRDERPWGSGVPPAVFYRYAPDRKGEQAEALLKPAAGDSCMPMPIAGSIACIAPIR